MTNRIAVRATFSADGAASATFALPTTRAPGDLMLAAVSTSNYTPTTPVGWTLESNVGTGTAGVAGSVGVWVYSRVVQAGDSNTINFSATGADYIVVTGIILIGANATFIDAVPTTNTTTPASQTYTLASITTVTANAWLVGFIAVDADSTSARITAPLTNATVIDETLQVSRSVSTGTGGQLFGQTGRLVTLGAAGALTRTETTTASISVSIQMAIRPADSTTLTVYQEAARVVAKTPVPTLSTYQTTARVVRSIATVTPPTQATPRIVICM